jgi:hypothetical protein
MTTIDKYQRMRVLLNEKQWRQYLATEAEERENAAVVAREAKVSINTIARGRSDIETGDLYTPGNRIRAKGAGPKRIIDTDPTLTKDLESLVEPKGDPMSLLRWTTKSLAHLTEALEQKKHRIKKSALATVLASLHFSLKANKKNNVGVDHDTASFAVESIRRWWKNVGKALYPKKTELLITSDGGGSNGVRNRLWKKELQQLANETKLSITVSHLPPATSKWNKIEHRLFSYISINWRGTPLTSLETIIELLSHTTTEKGLTVTAVVDKNIYPIGVKVSDAEMASLNITRNEFHGEWNYTIGPTEEHANVK